jgi:hypothetical protein
LPNFAVGVGHHVVRVGIHPDEAGNFDIEPFFLAGPGIESGSRTGFFVPYMGRVPISAARRDSKESS